jgi:hypothetical protein
MREILVKCSARNILEFVRHDMYLDLRRDIYWEFLPSTFQVT